MNSKSSVNKFIIITIVFICLLFLSQIIGFARFGFDSSKIVTITNSGREISFMDPRGLDIAPFEQSKNKDFFFMSTRGNPLVRDFGFSCFDAYENLMKIEVYGPGFLDFAPSIQDLELIKQTKASGVEKYGNNTYFVFSNYASVNNKVYILFGNSTVFKLAYLPDTCMWKGHDYSNYLAKILESVTLKDMPMTQDEIDKTNQKFQTVRETLGIKSDSPEIGVFSENDTEIDVAEAIIDNKIALGLIDNSDKCDAEVSKLNIRDRLKNTIIIYCIGEVREKMTERQQASPKQEYKVCGENYSFQKIEKVKGLDLVSKFSSLTNILPIKKDVCDDFKSLFTGKTIGLDHREYDGYYYLTMYDISDERYNQQITMPTIGVSFGWDTNAVYYFPSTLESGEATYIGDLK